jgi:hypothetical protein
LFSSVFYTHLFALEGLRYKVSGVSEASLLELFLAQLMDKAGT